MEQILNPDLYEFVVAKSKKDKEKIYASRAENYHRECNYLLQYDKNGHPGKDSFDDRSILFYIAYQGEVAASCRCTSYENGEWEITASLMEPLPFSPDSESFVQFNRVLVDHRFRKNALHEFMFLQASYWMIENTSFKYYFAVCKLMMLRFYTTYGAILIPADPVKLIGRADFDYYFIRGDIGDTATLLEENIRRKNMQMPILSFRKSLS